MAKLGLHSLAFMELWQAELAASLLPRFYDYGVRVIETPLLDYKAYDAEATKRVISQNKMELVCSLGLPETVDPQKDLEAAQDYLAGAIDKAAEAGSKVLSGVTYGSIGKTSGAPRTEDEMDAICALLDTAAMHAKSRGLRLGIEPCNRYETHLLNTAQQSFDLIERIGADNIFIHLDSYHMNIEEAGFAEGFAQAGKHFGYLHLSESNRGVPGRGTINWSQLFAGLAKSGFAGTMTLESFVFLAPEIASGLAVWRPVADKPDEVISEGLPFLLNMAKDAGVQIEI